MARFNFQKIWDDLFGIRVAPEELGGRIVEMKPIPREKFQEDIIENATKVIDDRPDITAIPGGRVSQPSIGSNIDLPGMVTEMTDSYSVVNIQFIRMIIPIIRALATMNADISQALYNIQSLGNTGHKIYFDKNVSPKDQERMRNHLENVRKNWASGQAGMDGVVNKMLAQLMIGGALSTEWVPNDNLTGIENCVFVDPENIVFVLNKAKSKYEAYQRPRNSIFKGNKKLKDGLIKLNPNTYRYFALNGDGEMPYGIPPYIPAVQRVQSQSRMQGNIDFIVDTMGLVGFLEVLMEKPQMGNVGPENVTQYTARLESLLSTAKTRVLAGMSDGVVVGFKEDHEFRFNTAAKSFDGVTQLFQENELQIASSVKQDAALWGRGYSTSETQITVVFTKLLSELRNIQNIVKTNLEFGYALELRLAGFNFEYLKVEFNRSTIQDDYKFQQAQEIKIRNAIAKRLAGIIDQDTMADELGYETPAAAEAIVPWEVVAGKGGTKDGEEAEKKKTVKKGKGASEKKARPKANR